MEKLLRSAATISAVLVLTSCASTGQLVTAPGVSLRNVEALDLGFSSQTFLLGFDVTNPNSFPLPVHTVSYGIELDGYRFATGKTPAGFTIPAAGDAQFAISVELDLLKSAPKLLYIVRDAAKRPIPYELTGQFGLDIPLADPVSFRTAGLVRMQKISRQALQLP